MARMEVEDGRGKRGEGRWGDYGTTRLRDYWTAGLRNCGGVAKGSARKTRQTRPGIGARCCSEVAADRNVRAPLYRSMPPPAAAKGSRGHRLPLHVPQESLTHRNVAC